MDESISASHERKRASPRLISSLPLFLRYVSPTTSCPDSVNNCASVCLKDCRKGRETVLVPFFFFFCAKQLRQAVTAHSGSVVVRCFQAPFSKGACEGERATRPQKHSRSELYDSPLLPPSQWILPWCGERKGLTGGCLCSSCCCAGEMLLVLSLL